MEPRFGDGGCAVSFSTWAVGYDIAIDYDTGTNRFDSSQNWSKIVNVVGITVGSLLTAAGVLLLWVPVAGPTLTVAGITITAGAIATTATVTTVGSAVLTLGGIASEVAQTILTPAQFKSWYGNKDYSCVVQGGFIYDKPPSGKPPAGNQLPIKGFDPIKLTWENTDTGESGTSP